MRPIKHSRKEVIELFYQHKVLDKRRIQQITGCSGMTLWRILNAHGYHTSYNFNARYYTLADIPEFDGNGLWSYRDIKFSEYGSLTGTVHALVLKGPMGFSAQELQEYLSVRVGVPLIKLCRLKKIGREKLGGIFIYGAPDDQKRKQQLQKRQAQREQQRAREELPDSEKIIGVLVELVKRNDLQPYQVQSRLSRKGVTIRIDDIRTIFEHYQLRKKNS